MWQDNSFVNAHSSMCLTDFHKGTLGTATCDGRPSQHWTRQLGGAAATIRHPGTNRCLTMPPIDPSNTGQVFGRALANDSFALLFYNPAPATSLSSAQSICCDALCWAELSAGVAATGRGRNVSGSFEVEDVWSGVRNGTTIAAGNPFCVEVGTAGENSRTYRLDPIRD